MKKIIFESSGRPAPSSLTNWEGWEELKVSDKNKFISRIYFLEEMSSKILSFLEKTGDFESDIDFISHIELDLLILLSTDDFSSESSIMQVHESWSMFIERGDLLNSIPSSLIFNIEDDFINIVSSENEFYKWLNKRSECLISLIDGFFNARSFVSVVAHLIGIDICLAGLLRGITKQRFNSRLSSTN